MSQSEHPSLDDIYGEYMKQTSKFDKRKFANYVRTYYGGQYKYSQIQMYVTQRFKPTHLQSYSMPRLETITENTVKTEQIGAKSTDANTRSNSVISNLSNTQDSGSPDTIDITDTLDNNDINNDTKPDLKKSKTIGSLSLSNMDDTDSIDTAMTANKNSKHSSKNNTKNSGSKKPVRRARVRRSASAVIGKNAAKKIQNALNSSNTEDDVPSWVKSRPKLRHTKQYDSYKIKIICVSTGQCSTNETSGNDSNSSNNNNSTTDTTDATDVANGSDTGNNASEEISETTNELSNEISNEMSDEMSIVTVSDTVSKDIDDKMDETANEMKSETTDLNTNGNANVNENDEIIFFIEIDSAKMKNYTIFNLQSDIIKKNLIKDATYLNLTIKHRKVEINKMNELVIKYWKKKSSNVITFRVSLNDSDTNNGGNKTGVKKAKSKKPNKKQMRRHSVSQWF